MHNTLFNCSYDFFWFSNPNTKHAMIFCQNIFQVSFTLIGAIHILLYVGHSYFVQKEWITYTYLRPCVSLFLIFRLGRWTLLDWLLSVYYFRSLPFIAWEIAPLFVLYFRYLLHNESDVVTSVRGEEWHGTALKMAPVEGQSQGGEGGNGSILGVAATTPALPSLPCMVERGAGDAPGPARRA